MNARAILVFVAFCVRQVSANTEIVNFDAVDALYASITTAEHWLELKPGSHEVQLSLPPAALNTPLRTVCDGDESWVKGCPHELWLVLAIDAQAWKKYGKFTLRVSWPASSPADFLLDIYEPRQVPYFGAQSIEEQARSDLRTTRNRYARIRVVDAGVRTPWPGVNLTAPAPDVHFRLICEPLVFGILPQTLVPTLLILVPIIVFAVIGSGFVRSYLQRIIATQGAGLREKSS